MHRAACNSRFLLSFVSFLVSSTVGLLHPQSVIAQQPAKETLIVWPKGRDTTVNMTTLQQLQHKVPRKAQKEMQKAEQARVAGHQDEAISRYNATISIDPEYTAARNNLALVYIGKEEFQLGIEQLQEAIKADSHNSVLFKNLGIGFLLDRQLAAAENALRQASDLNRSDSQVRMMLGLALIQQGKFNAEALRCLVRAMNEFPLAHLLAGRVLAGQGSTGKAKSEIELYLASGDTDNRELALRWIGMLNRKSVELAMASPAIGDPAGTSVR